jgi:quinol monooxygenase YgiN
MIRTLLTLRLEPAKISEVLDLYRADDILQYSLDHSDAVASEISVAADGSGEILVTAVWPDAAAYQGWLDNPWRAQSGVKLRELLRDAEVGEGRIFDIDHDVRKP